MIKSMLKQFEHKGGGLIMNFIKDISLIGILSAMLRMAAPLLLACLGGLFTARAGIINLALEGIMLMGAFAGFVGAYLSGSLLIGLIFSILGGVSMSLILGILSIHGRANQTVAGVGINIVSLGITSYLFKVFFSGKGLIKAPSFNPISIPFLTNIPFFGKAIFHETLLVYLAFAMVPIVWYMLYRTPYGLIIRATGEHPKTVDTLGGNVFRVRYVSIIILGTLAGLGGACLTIGQTGTFAENITAGKGYIALAALIFGRFTPIGSLVSALIFGFFEAIQLRLQTAGAAIPHQFLTMLPYIMTLLALTVFVKSSKVPASMGKPYNRQN